MTLDEIADAYVRGEATEAQVRELFDALQAGGEPARRLASRLADTTLIAGWLRAEADASFVPEALAANDTKSDDPAFVRATLDRVARKHTRRSRLRPGSSGTPWPFFAAAAVLIAILLLVFSSSEKPQTPQVRSTPKPLMLPRDPEPPREEVPAPPQPRSPEPEPPKLPNPPPPPEPRPESPKPEPPAPPAPAPGVPVPEAPKPQPPRTVVDTPKVVAVLERLDGKVLVNKTAARKGQEILAGQEIETSGRRSAASVKFQDGTRLELSGDTTIKDLQAADAKTLAVAQGSVTATVAPQPKPMVFSTAQADITVLGTTLRIALEAGATRLEVVEGKVRMSRRLDGATVEVVSGHYAVAAAGAEFVSKLSPIDEILLFPAQGKMQGAEWRTVKDPGVSSGTALETIEHRGTRFTPAASDAHVSFEFQAEAGKIYSVWIRGRCLAARERFKYDAVILEFPTAAGVEEQPGPNKGRVGPGKALFNDFQLKNDYWWLGGHAENGIDQTFKGLTTVTFTASGPQTLRLFAFESPMRIDAIWLSATQKTRPEDTQVGPRVRKP